LENNKLKQWEEMEKGKHSMLLDNEKKLQRLLINTFYPWWILSYQVTIII
jgi:hypothetical protein